MFIKVTKKGCNRDGGQFCHGYFMVWVGVHQRRSDINKGDQVFDHTNLWATVRQIKMRQLGHWMMGEVQIGKRRIGLSGALGGDGLPASVYDTDFLDLDFLKVWLAKYFEPVPHEVYKTWATDNGHNTVNDSTGVIREYGNRLYLRTYNKLAPQKVFYGHPDHPPHKGPLAPIPKESDYVLR